MKVDGKAGEGGTMTSVGHFDMVGLFLKNVLMSTRGREDANTHVCGLWAITRSSHSVVRV